ncbi:MAG TPA: hypothetical protein VHR72_10535 [Gemmataceae bacterium]|jgi:hypothetical protein|nr:hypothetical protein [Gemmataceae bacterium]
MTNERPSPKWGIYAAPWFCAAISAITIIGTLVVYSISGGANPSMLVVFLCNLPLAFMFAAYPLKLANDRIQSLEDRLRELEAAQVAR